VVRTPNGAILFAGVSLVVEAAKKDIEIPEILN
jgi:hypothetical protein